MHLPDPCGFFPESRGIMPVLRLFCALKEVEKMTLNLIFTTVTIKRLKKTAEQRQRDEEVFRLYDEMNAKREAFQVRHF